MQQLREMEKGMDDAQFLLQESEKQVTSGCFGERFAGLLF